MVRVILPQIKRWFAPLVFPDDETKTRRAGLLNAALINILTLMPVLAIGNLLGGRTPWPVFAANAGALAVCLWVRDRMHRGQIRLASAGLIALGFALITVSAVSLGTIRAPTTAMYLLLVISAGLFFELRGMVITAAFSSLVVGGLIVAQNAGWLPPPDHSVTITQWIAYTAIFGWGGALTLSALQALRQALARAEVEMSERQAAEAALRASEENYRTLFETMAQGAFIQQADGALVDCNPAVLRMFGVSRDQFLSRTSLSPAWRVLREDGSEFPGEQHPSMVALRTGQPVRDVVAGVFNPRQDDYVWLTINAQPMFEEGADKPYQAFVTLHDITDRKRVELENDHYLNQLTALHVASLAFTHLNALDLLGQKIIEAVEQLLDWRRGSIWLLDETGAGLRLFAHSEMGLDRQQLQAELARVRILVPRLGEGISGWVALHGKPVRTGDVKHDPRYIEADPAIRSELCVPLEVGGRTIGCINVESTQPNAFSARDEQLLTTLASQAAIAIENARLFDALQRELAERQGVEALLREALADLQRSNTELEQFAYVASHDLQEPLRMVTSFVQLLGDHYRGQLDADADEFIGYAVDGAKRMQQLILDLLGYSRVGTRGQPPQPTDANAALDDALWNLGLAIAEAGACVTHDPLPVVLADPVQLSQLLQNLIGNAIKFRGAESPQVHISARETSPRETLEVSETSRVWEFAVRDNGIGIEPQFFERIFVIFQRLHNRAAYGGTGIGLAICKKIVERHGGRIWVESALGQGSTFYFTLPAA